MLHLPGLRRLELRPQPPAVHLRRGRVQRQVAPARAPPKWCPSDTQQALGRCAWCAPTARYIRAADLIFCSSAARLRRGRAARASRRRVEARCHLYTEKKAQPAHGRPLENGRPGASLRTKRRYRPGPAPTKASQLSNFLASNIGRETPIFPQMWLAQIRLVPTCAALRMPRGSSREGRPSSATDGVVRRGWASNGLVQREAPPRRTVFRQPPIPSDLREARAGQLAVG